LDDNINESIKKNIRDFKKSSAWKRIPLLGKCQRCDEGGLSRMCIYQRNTTTEDETWSTANADLASESQPNKWPTQECDDCKKKPKPKFAGED
jgi:hypothetical protein